MARRQDYGYPFRIDPGSGQGGQAGYADHVEQMIRQVLLTSPGERVDLPEFGCGLRRMVFAGHSRAVDTSTQILVQQSLGRWLGSQIRVQQVRVLSPEQTGDEAVLSVEIDYLLVEDLSQRTSTVRVIG
jgi:phage baseplate assembly protein W